jgi:WD40 repeat protein
MVLVGGVVAAAAVVAVAVALANSGGGGSRASVVAADRAGRSGIATSAPTALIARASGVAHLEYLFNDGPVHVYDIDHGFRLVETFRLAGTDRGVRGVAVSPGTHMMFDSYGGDGGGNGNGSVLAYDLVRKRIVWSVNLKTGIDSAAVSNDARLLYMPDGELSSDGTWYILSTANGSVVGKIQTHGSGPHDGVMSADGRILQLGDRNYSRLTIYNTATGSVQAQIGPLVGGVRPNTINGADSLAFTTATGFDGFQISSITRPGNPVLFTERFAACSGPFSTCSHGISLSPNNRELAVIDTVHKAVQLWDVHAVAAGVAPVHLATVRVDGLQGQESGCAYDCARDGWLQNTLDGRYVVAGDTGDVIDIATHRVVARLGNLLNTRKFVEIDWRGGVPVASSGRQGVGRQR